MTASGQRQTTRTRQSKAEWLSAVAAEHNITAEQLLAERARRDQHPEPCDCDWAECTGWAWSERPDDTALPPGWEVDPISGMVVRWNGRRGRLRCAIGRHRWFIGPFGGPDANPGCWDCGKHIRVTDKRPRAADPPAREAPADDHPATCCACGIEPATYENYAGYWFCRPCADGVEHPAIASWRAVAERLAAERDAGGSS